MTLVEVVIAILIMTVGMLAAFAAVTYAVSMNRFSKSTSQGKMVMSAMLEQIETLRNTGQLTFNQIANEDEVQNPPTGFQFAGFPRDFKEISRSAGADGIFGTADDNYGSLDPAYNGYTRRVLITNINSTLKRVDVTLRYPGFGSNLREMTITSYINDNNRTNQRN